MSALQLWSNFQTFRWNASSFTMFNVHHKFSLGLLVWNLYFHHIFSPVSLGLLCFFEKSRDVERKVGGSPINYTASFLQNADNESAQSISNSQNGKNSNKCNQCDFVSSQAPNLRRHLKLHSAEKSIIPPASRRSATSFLYIQPIQQQHPPVFEISTLWRSIWNILI